MYSLIQDTWDAEEIKSIHAVIDSNRFSMGPKVKEFENKFADFFNVKHAIFVNSGSSANLIAIAALRFYKDKLSFGDEIIVPSVGWSTTYSPLFYSGFVPKFVDISSDSFNINSDKIIEAINSKTKAIFVVNLLGKSCDFNKIKKICAEKNLLLIEDNCEAMGATYENKYCGTHGLAGTFSFFYSHHITTIEGGMITTNDDEFADICISLRAHGWLRDISVNSHLYDKSVSDFKRLFWFVLPGFNVRPMEFQGAIGSIQLNKFNVFLTHRKNNLNYFHEKISKYDFISTQTYDDEHSGFSFPIIVDATHDDRDNLLNTLRINKIEARPIASGDITKHPFMDFWHSAIRRDSFPVSEWMDANGFMVGNHPTDMRDNIDYLFKVIDKHYKN